MVYFINVVCRMFFKFIHKSQLLFHVIKSFLCIVISYKHMFVRHSIFIRVILWIKHDKYTCHMFCIIWQLAIWQKQKLKYNFLANKKSHFIERKKQWHINKSCKILHVTKKAYNQLFIYIYCWHKLYVVNQSSLMAIRSSSQCYGSEARYYCRIICKI